MTDSTHLTFYCKKHKKLILYFARDKALTGHHCWDCIKEKNDADWKASKKKEDLDKD